MQILECRGHKSTSSLKYVCVSKELVTPWIPLGPSNLCPVLRTPGKLLGELLLPLRSPDSSRALPGAHLGQVAGAERCVCRWKHLCGCVRGCVCKGRHASGCAHCRCSRGLCLLVDFISVCFQGSVHVVLVLSVFCMWCGVRVFTHGCAGVCVCVSAGVACVSGCVCMHSLCV